ncbi:baseplate protein [Bacillus phage vB_BcM_Sam46]|uniref:Baseplate protein n=2 Tax=Caudoviricetes TaxID=2731619 RepID=A0A6G9L9I0_9CAUD|nr:baseplate protein [Bacillus phage vB_BcM_Sam112]QIQ61222.1 baseplate protein [Bacillus phage vB_BcM_Sam46]
MFDFKLVKGDIIFGSDRNIVLVSEDDELIQAIAEIMNVNAGEWFLNDEHGLRRYDILGRKQQDIDEFKNTISEAIFQEPRVEEITSLDVNFDKKTRTLTVVFEIMKKDQTIVMGEVNVNVNG